MSSYWQWIFEVGDANAAKRHAAILQNAERDPRHAVFLHFRFCERSERVQATVRTRRRLRQRSDLENQYNRGSEREVAHT
jgi:hypothetical protein